MTLISTSRRVRPGRVRLAVFPYHFTHGSLQWSFFVAIKGTSSDATTIGSRTGIDLKVVFFVGLQSTLSEAHARSLGSLKTRVAMMRRPEYSSVEIMVGRPRCGHDIGVVMTQMCLNDLISKMRFVDTCQDHVINHVPKSCN